MQTHTRTHKHSRDPRLAPNSRDADPQDTHTCAHTVTYTPPPTSLETEAHTNTIQTHTWPQLIMGPLIKKNDALRNSLLEEDGEKRGIWTKGGPFRLGGGTDRQLMAVAPSVY